MPEQMTTAQARVVDAVLSTHARGYVHAKRVGGALFPTVPVTKHGGQVIEFDKESFKKYRTRRAPGAHKTRIRFGYEGKAYGLKAHDIEVPLPDEIVGEAAGVVPGQSLGQRAVNLGMDTLTLELEDDQATIARNAANYDANHKVALAGTDRWTDYANSTPLEDWEAGREAIRASTGMYPNVGLLSAKAFKAIKRHPDILDLIKFTQTGVVTAELLAVLLEVDRIEVGKEVTADADGNFSDVWGNDVVMAFAPEDAGGLEVPSYGYTYTMQGHPAVLQPYRENQSDSWIYPVNFHRSPEITGMAAGYLIQNAGDDS